MIGYQTAYLKAHYPAEFMAALLTSDQQDIDRIAIEIEECRAMGIQVLAPDINESFASFTVVAGEKRGRIHPFRLERHQKCRSAYCGSDY
jgi:DNA polymerase-3 subunit alpha